MAEGPFGGLPFFYFVYDSGVSDRRHKTSHRGISYRNGSDDPDAWPRRYIVWYEDSLGRGRTETLPSGSNLKAAVERQAELRGKRARGERIIPTTVTFADFVDQWLEQQKGRLKPKTIATYAEGARRLKDRIGTKRVASIDADEVSILVRSMQNDGYSAWTIRGSLVVLSRTMQLAQRKGYVHRNPVSELDRWEKPKIANKRMRILSTKEIEVLLPAVPDRYRSLITLLLFTGMRISEALSLRWEDVDFNEGSIFVRAGKTENAVREIAMMPSIASLLRSYRISSGRRQGQIFQMDRHTVLRRGLKKGVENAGIAPVTLHELRHTYASILISEGMNVVLVCDQMGHANPSITLKLYAHLYDPLRGREKARKALEASFGQVAQAATRTRSEAILKPRSS